MKAIKCTNNDLRNVAFTKWSGTDERANGQLENYMHKKKWVLYKVDLVTYYYMLHILNNVDNKICPVTWYLYLCYVKCTISTCMWKKSVSSKYDFLIKVLIVHTTQELGVNINLSEGMVV